MKRLLALSAIFCLAVSAFATEQDTTKSSGNLPDSISSGQRGMVDSLRAALKKIEGSYYIFKARTDTSHALSEADQQELLKLSDSIDKMGGEIRELTGSAGQLADEAADIYGVESVHIESGDYTLSSEETVEDNIEVLNGDAFIYGSIKGSLIVVNGDAFIRNNAETDGDLIVINGKAHVGEKAQVSGAVIEREGNDLEARRKLVQRISLSEHPDIWLNHDILFDHLAANYNRVDGLFLGLGSEKDYYWSGIDNISPYGYFGYAFNLHRWRYQIGIDKWFGNEDRFEIGGEGHSFTDSKDDWIVGPKENFVYSILAREDFMDYYNKQGASFHVAQYYQMNSRITLSYDIDDYSSLSKTTKWSLFGGHKMFRDNPPIDDGWMRSIVVDLEHRSFEGGELLREGWIADLHGETTVNGDFDFKMLSLQAARYQPLSAGLQLNVRFKAGTSTGYLPLQRTFQIGGFNTLNAFPYKDFSGNRLLLLNIEFLFSSDIFRHSSFFPFNTFDLLLLSDIGQVGDAGTVAGLTSGWNVIDAAGIKSDYGIGIGSNDGNFRIFLAWRTDVAASPTLGIRLARPF